MEEETREEVRRRTERLPRQYGSFSVDEATVEFEPEYFEHVKKKAEAGCIGDASAWITDDAGQALLIRDRESPNEWDTPGGGHEPGETMEETARREVREETGVECTVTGVNYLRRNAIALASDLDERYYMLTVVFDATFDSGSISVDEEVLEAEWFSEPPEIFSISSKNTS